MITRKRLAAVVDELGMTNKSAGASMVLLGAYFWPLKTLPKRLGMTSRSVSIFLNRYRKSNVITDDGEVIGGWTDSDDHAKCTIDFVRDVMVGTGELTRRRRGRGFSYASVK